MADERLFVAAPVTAAVRRAVEAVVVDLKRTCSTDVRWSSAEDLHVTLAYLGEVDEHRIVEIAGAASSAVDTTAGFELGVRGVRAFPDDETPSVVWIGFDEGDAALVELQESVAEAMVGLGFELEARPFVPHITIGRVSGKHPMALMAQAMRPHRDRDFGPLAVTEVALYASEPVVDDAANRSRYRVVATFPMRSG